MGLFSKGKKKDIFSFKKHRKTKIGLALGGGGTRGFTHLGAIKAFEEYCLKFDYISGTSVGSLVGAFLADGKNFEEMYEIAKNVDVKDIKTNKIFFMPSSSEGIESFVENNLSCKKIEKLKIPYSAIAVDLKSTKECILTKGNLAKAIAGSCAVPGIFKPVAFEDLLLSDGGLQNTIPAFIPKMMGCDYVVAIDVNPARGYGTESSKVLDVLACSIRILMKSNAVKGYLNSDVILKPDTKRFKSTKTDNIEDMIEEGYREAIDKMPQILKLFSQKPLKKKKKSQFFDNGVIIK